MQLMQFDSAEADCDQALKLELSVKTLLRRGTARRGRQDIEGARRDFKHALGLEPNNRWAQPLACLPLCLLQHWGMYLRPPRAALKIGRLLLNVDQESVASSASLSIAGTSMQYRLIWTAKTQMGVQGRRATSKSSKRMNRVFAGRQARQDLQRLKEEEETLRSFSNSAVPDAETNGHSTAAEEPVFL